MSLEIRCPAGHRVEVSPRDRGMQARCPVCDRPFRIPLAAESGAGEVRGPGDARGAGGPNPDGPTAARPAADEPDDSRRPRSESAGFDPPLRPSRRHLALPALGIVLLALLQVAPAIKHLDLATAPPWARVSILLALLETAYAAWIVLAPDWSTMRVAMFVTAAVATLYCAALGANLLTPRFAPAPLDMQQAPGGASLWCATIACGALSLTYACGRWCHRWRS